MQHPLIFAAAFCFALPGVSLAADDPAKIVCHQRETTVDIMECLNGLTVQWDKRLNTVYQGALEASESGDRHTALAQAERAWLAFRKDNCGWCGAQEGTIREVAGAQCMLTMTRDRATELEASLRP